MDNHESPQYEPQEHVRQSYAGSIRQRLARIERSIHNGLRHEAIRQQLANEGVEASIGTFRKSLSRARVWWRKQFWQQQMARSSSLAQSTEQALPARVEAVREPGHDQAAMADPLVVLTAVPATRQASEHERGHDLALTPKPIYPRAMARPQSERLSERRTVPRPGINPSDLDQFFQRKSVFNKS